MDKEKNKPAARTKALDPKKVFTEQELKGMMVLKGAS